MAPRRVVRKYVGFVDRHRDGILAVLLVLGVVLSLLAAAGWLTARSAEQRVGRLEIQRQVEEQGEKVGRVVSCFSAARTRPILVTVLRALAGREEDTVVRAAFARLIDNFEMQATPGIEGRPTRGKCLELAGKEGVDPAPYDFDPETGELLHPVEDT